MQPEKKREYHASFEFKAGPEIPARSTRLVELGDEEDFALLAVSIRASESTIIEDFRTILYNCGLEIGEGKLKPDIEVPLTSLPSTSFFSPPVPGSEAIALCHYWAGSLVTVDIVFDPARPTGKRISAPVKITICLTGVQRHKAKKKKVAKKKATKKKATKKAPAGPSRPPGPYIER